MIPGAAELVLFTSLGLAAGGPVSSGRGKEAQERRNAATDCPYCHGDPELMRKAGILSHGGFEFGVGDTASSERILPEVPLLWIETAHFEIGMGMETYRIGGDERERVQAELVELERALPAVMSRTRVLDPWLRLHLYAWRLDRLWARMSEILGVTDADFPAAGTEWLIGEPYHGEGPHLGMGGKFELLIVPSSETQERWLYSQFGLRTQRTQRWNVTGRQTMIAVINADETRLRRDAALYGHTVFTLTINLVDGYEFYAYETPVWLREGLAHVLERELDPRYNSFSFSESSLADETTRSDWTSAVRKLVARGDAPSIAELAHLQTPAQFTLEHHFAAWSMTTYLLAEHPEGYACLMAALHGNKNAKGEADGSVMVDKHRDAFEKCIGKRYHDFDAAWQSWAERVVARKDEGRRFRIQAPFDADVRMERR